MFYIHTRRSLGGRTLLGSRTVRSTPVALAVASRSGAARACPRAYHHFCHHHRRHRLSTCSASRRCALQLHLLGAAGQHIQVLFVVGPTAVHVNAAAIPVRRAASSNAGRATRLCPIRESGSMDGIHGQPSTPRRMPDSLHGTRPLRPGPIPCRRGRSQSRTRARPTRVRPTHSARWHRRSLPPLSPSCLSLLHVVPPALSPDTRGRPLRPGPSPCRGNHSRRRIRRPLTRPLSSLLRLTDDCDGL